MGCAESSDLGSPTIRCRMRLRFFKTKLLMIDQDYWETAPPSQGFDEKRISRKRGSARLPAVQACPRCCCEPSPIQRPEATRSRAGRPLWGAREDLLSGLGSPVVTLLEVTVGSLYSQSL